MKRLLAISLLISACGGTVTPSPAATTAAPSAAEVEPATARPTATPTAPSSPSEVPSESFVSYLAGYGQRFTPTPVPAGGVVSAQSVLAKLRAENFPPLSSADPVAQAPIYGIVTCVDPSKNCAQRGLVRPGESLAIWLVGYPTVPGGNGGQAWATVDAKTGSFINGDGPPGG